MGNWGEITLRGYFTPFITARGPPCMSKPMATERPRPYSPIVVPHAMRRAHTWEPAMVRGSQGQNWRNWLPRKWANWIPLKGDLSQKGSYHSSKHRFSGAMIVSFWEGVIDHHWQTITLKTLKHPSLRLTLLRMFELCMMFYTPLKMYFLLNMGIFHCYVSLPEGTFCIMIGFWIWCLAP